MKIICWKFILIIIGKGNLKLTLQDQHYEPIAEISIDSNEISLLSNEFLLKNYSENEEIVKSLLRSGKILPTNHIILLKR